MFRPVRCPHPLLAFVIPMLIVSFALAPHTGLAGPNPAPATQRSLVHHDEHAMPPEAARLLQDGGVGWTVTPDTGSGFVAATLADTALIVPQSRSSGEDATATLIAIDPDTGTRTWNFAIDGTSATTPIVLGGTVYTAATGGELVYALDAATGTEHWRRPVGSGRVLAVTADQLLVEGSALYAPRLA